MPNYGKYYIAVRLLLLKQYLEANAGKNRIVSRKELEGFLEEQGMGIEKKTIYATCFTVQDIFLKTVHESFLSWEAHLHFLHLKHPPKRKNRKHIITLLESRMCFLAFLLRKVGFELFTVQIRGFTLLLQALLNRYSKRWYTLLFGSFCRSSV